jgi:hypothetical protein
MQQVQAKEQQKADREHLQALVSATWPEFNLMQLVRQFVKMLGKKHLITKSREGGKAAFALCKGCEKV